jgi:hypothetical protein
MELIWIESENDKYLNTDRAVDSHCEGQRVRSLEIEQEEEEEVLYDLVA